MSEYSDSRFRPWRLSDDEEFLLEKRAWEEEGEEEVESDLPEDLDLGELDSDEYDDSWLKAHHWDDSAPRRRRDQDAFEDPDEWKQKRNARWARRHTRSRRSSGGDRF